MTDTGKPDPGDLGELRGQVRGLMTGFAELGRKLDEGLTTLGNIVRAQGEKFDQRLADQQMRTDKRFEDWAAANLQAVNARGAQSWTIFAYIGTSLLGLIGLGSTFYTITRSPIDANIARIEGTQAAYATMLGEMRKDFDGKIASTENKFVPRGEVQGFVSTTTADLTDLARRVRDQEQGGAGRNARLDAVDKRLDAQNTTIRDDRNNAATKQQLSDLRDNVNTVSNRVQTVYDKAYVPAYLPASPPPVAGTAGR